MSAVAHLLASNIYTVIPAAFEHCFAECLGTVGIGALTNSEECVVLCEGNVLVEAGNTRIVLRLARGELHAADAVNDGLEVGGGCATTATNQSQTELFHKLFMGSGKFFWTEWVTCTICGELGQTRIRHHHDGDRRVLRQLA